MDLPVREEMEIRNLHVKFIAETLSLLHKLKLSKFL